MTFVIEEGVHGGIQSEKAGVVEVIGQEYDPSCTVWDGYELVQTLFFKVRINDTEVSKVQVLSVKMTFSSMAVARQERLQLKIALCLDMYTELKMRQGFVILNKQQMVSCNDQKKRKSACGKEDSGTLFRFS